MAVNTSGFVVTLVIDSIVGLILFLLFCVFRRMSIFEWIYYPRLNPNRRKSAAVPSPPKPPNTLFGWIRHTYNIDNETLLRSCGMDSTMYTMWFGSMFRLMIWLLVPSIAILLPVNITSSGQSTGFDALSMSNIPENSPRLWAHLIVFYYSMCITMYWLYRSYRLWLTLRIDYLKQSMFKGGAMSLAFTDLPKSLRDDQAFYHFAYDCFGDHLHSVYLPRDLNKLNKAIQERSDVINELEYYITKQQKLYTKRKRSHSKSIDQNDVNKHNNNTHEDDIHKNSRDTQHNIDISDMHDDNNDNSIPQLRQRSQYSNNNNNVNGTGSQVDLPLPSVTNNDTDNNKHNDVNDIKLTIQDVQNNNSNCSNNKQQQQSWLNNNLPPLYRYKWCGLNRGFHKLDIIQHYTERLNQLNNIIADEQKDAPSKPPQNVGIVTLRSALITSMASRTPGSVDPFNLHIRPAPEPEDIDWNNIRLDDDWKRARSFLINCIVITGIIFYCVPVTFFTGLTSIDGLQKVLPGVAAAAQSNIILNGLITGFLPSLGYIIFMALLPLLLNIASTAEGRPSRSNIQMGVFEKYFYFQFINFFIFTVFSGAVLNLLSELIANPGSAAVLFGKTVPIVATQFINYIVTRVFIMQFLKLLAYDDLLLNSIGAFFARTKRQKERALNNLTNPSFGGDFPVNITIWIIAITYVVIAPILMPFALGFFGCGYIISKYQALYMNVAKYETGGLFWPRAFNRMVVGMCIAELAMIGIFGVKKAAAQSVLCVPLFIITMIYGYYMNQTFSAWTGLLPLEAALEIDRGRRDNMSKLEQYEDVRSYRSTKGISPYRQPELLAPINLQPFYSDPLTVVLAEISEGVNRDLGEAPRADVPSRLELYHQHKIENDNFIDKQTHLGSINGNPEHYDNHILNNRKKSVIHTHHYNVGMQQLHNVLNPDDKQSDDNNNNNNNDQPSNNASDDNDNSVFNQTRRQHDGFEQPTARDVIMKLHNRRQHQTEHISAATELANSIDIQKSKTDNDKYVSSKIQSNDDITPDNTNANHKSVVQHALDVV